MAKTNSERLVAWRKLKGLSQAKAAEQLGVQQGVWAPWETGTKSPDRLNSADLETLTEGAVPARDWPLSKKRRARRASASLPLTSSKRTGNAA